MKPVDSAPRVTTGRSVVASAPALGAGDREFESPRPDSLGTVPYLEYATTVKSSLETVSPTRVRITVELPPEALRPALDNAFRKIAQQVNVPGFRRGKVPARIIEQRFGRAAVLEEALNEAVPAAYQEAIDELGVKALGQPEIVIDQDLTALGDDDVVEFVAEVDVRPELVLPDYEALPIEVADNDVTDEDVAEQLDELRARFATVTPVERAVADDDLVVVDVAGEVDGEEIAEYTAAGMTFEVGSGKMIPGFDDAVRGASEGDVVEFSHTPEDGDHAGKEIALKVTVKGVRERELPEADDDFAQLASEFDTIDELRDDLRTRLARVKLVEQGIEARDKINEYFLANTEIPVPEGLVDQTVEQHFADGHGDDDHRAEFEDETRESLRSQFLLDALADAVEVQVEQDDLTQWIMQQAPRFQMTPDQFVQALVQADQLSNALGDVRRAKALSVVLEQAAITDASGRAVDLTALDEVDEDLEDADEDMYALADEDELDDDIDTDAVDAEREAAAEAELEAEEDLLAAEAGEAGEPEADDGKRDGDNS
ncbi:MAG: trigger factor [Actinomycetota bacterium]|nr:trigger factor [Actinomycetota bacterium]